MKRFARLFLVLCALTCFQATESTTARESRAAESAKVTVEAEGSGSTKMEAMKSAWMEAVRTAVGMFMASKTETVNDEIAEEIAVFSRGQVNSYEVLSENQSEGIWTIKIKANIDQDLLKETATKNSQSVNVTADKDVLAQASTAGEKSQSRADLLNVSKKLFDFTDCLAYSAKMEAYTDQSGQSGVVIRHELILNP